MVLGQAPLCLTPNHDAVPLAAATWCLRRRPAFANVISAQTLTFTWPKYPEANVEFPLTWSGGTPPVRGTNHPRTMFLVIDSLFFCPMPHSTRFTCLLLMCVLSSINVFFVRKLMRSPHISHNLRSTITNMKGVMCQLPSKQVMSRDLFTYRNASFSDFPLNVGTEVAFQVPPKNFDSCLMFVESLTVPQFSAVIGHCSLRHSISSTQAIHRLAFGPISSGVVVWYAVKVSVLCGYFSKYPHHFLNYSRLIRPMF